AWKHRWVWWVFVERSSGFLWRRSRYAMSARRLEALVAVLMLFAVGCAKPKPVPPPAPPPPQPAPPAPKQNIFALLEHPQGKTTAIVVTNTGGTQEIAQPNQAVRVEGSDVAPAAPYAIGSAAGRRVILSG